MRASGISESTPDRVEYSPTIPVLLELLAFGYWDKSFNSLSFIELAENILPDISGMPAVVQASMMVIS